MERLLFVYGWLTVLTDGRFFRFIFSNLLRITALVLTIYLIGDAIENIEQLLQLNTRLYSEAMLRPLAVQLILLLGGYATIHLILLRAAEIRTLYDARYALSEIITVLSRLVGETLFIVLLSITLISLLQMTQPSTTLQLLPQLHAFVAPWIINQSQLIILSAGIGLSFVVLVCGYLVSEMLEMVLRLSRNSERISP